MTTTNPTDPSTPTGCVAGIACRPKDGDAMTEVSSCEVLPGRGIASENRPPGKREITLISHEAWDDTCRELNVPLPWHTRRANLLIRGVDLSATLGRRLRIGDVEILIHGETQPCGIMDRQQPGLTRALVPEFRGGVFGQVLRGGTIRVGDAVVVRAEPRDPPPK